MKAPGPFDDTPLATLDAAGLQGLWRRLHRRPPPEALKGELLARVLAHRLQIARHGGLPAAARLRLKQAVADACARPAEDTGGQSASPPRSLRPGTRLIREWQGIAHEVDVVADGYLWQGQAYRSLSTLARAITGTSWNGWSFFGISRSKKRLEERLKKRSRERPKDRSSGGKIARRGQTDV